MANYEIFIPCRVTSRRLPYKHFRTIGGVTLIERLITQLSEMTGAQINLICPDGRENDIYEELGKLHSVSVFRGDEFDVLGRFFAAVSARKDQTQFAVRINGDSVLPSSQLLVALDEEIAQGQHDIYTTVGSGVPSGQHLEAVRVSWLLDQADSIAEATDHQREHVFPLLYDLCSRVRTLVAPRSAPVKLSVDSYRDLERMRYVIGNSSATDCDTVEKASEEFDSKHPFVGENGAYLIAEIGGNHEGDFDYAKELVRSACATEVDAIKLQVYSPDLLVNRKLDPDRWAHFKKFTLAPEQYKELFAMIRDAGKHTSASVWSLEEMAQHEADIDVLKVGSGDLNNSPMLRYLAKLDKPLVLSTGLTTIRQAEKAIQTVLDAGLSKEKLSILQCTSMYPIPEVEANLGVIGDFQRRFGCVVGYSDHTVGYETLLDSVTAGAQVLEFHFSDDTSNAGFRDHLVSLDEGDIAKFVDLMRQRIMRIGDAGKHLTMMERARNHPVSFRKGVFLRRDVEAGHIITEKDLIALRPLSGIDAFEFDDLVGARAVENVEALQSLSWEMFERVARRIPN